MLNPVRKADRKREVILAAALELFSRSGVDGASLDRVAERADVSKTNLIYYYPNKDALYAAVLNNVLSLWLVPLEVIDPARSAVASKRSSAPIRRRKVSAPWKPARPCASSCFARSAFFASHIAG